MLLLVVAGHAVWPDRPCFSQSVLWPIAVLTLVTSVCVCVGMNHPVGVNRRQDHIKQTVKHFLVRKELPYTCGWD